MSEATAKAIPLVAPRSARVKYLAAAVVAVLVMAAVVLVASRTIDQRGIAFFDTGKSIVDRLDTMAAALMKGDRPGIARAFAANFQGKDLGFGNLTLIETRDSVRKYFWASTDEGEGRDQAVDSWRAYVGALSPIEEFGLHLEKLESWSGGTIQAIVRLEAIGAPPGEPYAGIDRARFKMAFVRSPGGPQIVAASLVSGERLISDRPAFENVAQAAGVEFTNAYYPAFLRDRQAFGMIRYGPGGIAAVDYDNDGFYDLFIPDGVASRLFRNRGDGTFEDVTAAAGLSGLDGVNTAIFADFDNNGFKDAFISRTYSPNQLFRNNGDGTFTDVTKHAGIGADCCTTAASWLDYDNDGKLDLYVGRYLDPRTKIPTTFYARNGEPNQLYHNNGDGTFTNVTAEAGVGDPGLCLATVSADYDDDGYPDLFVVNDFGRSTLYHNDHDGTFSDVTVKAGALAYGAGMNATAGDFDNDGKIDLYTTDIRSEHAWFAESPTVWRYMNTSWRQGVWKTDMPLYFEMFRQSGFGFVKVFREMALGNHLLRNRGDGTFEDVAIQAGANPFGWFWGASLADFDNDGWQDIYAADGWVFNDRGTEIELDFLNNVVGKQDEYKTGRFFDPAYFGKLSWHGWERNRYLRANGDGTFTEMARAKGTDLMINSRGVAVADFWNRGVLDIAVSSSSRTHALLKNNGEPRHWLDVELVGTQSNRDAVGARLSAVAAGKRQTREVVLGDGYGSQNTLRQHFGLNDKTVVDELLVKWPKTGATQTFHSVPVDRIVQITEGSNELIQKTYAPPPPPENPLAGVTPVATP